VADYLPILTMVVLVLVFVFASVGVSGLLAPRRPTRAKTAPYECGIVPEQEPAERFPVRFYLVAMTFIVLDVEIVFLYPFTTVVRDLGGPGLAVMGVFLGVLLVPFAYLLSVGALAWAPGRARPLRVGPLRRSSGRPEDLPPLETREAGATRPEAA
jgi:NADH-quinone oxidoreductase subunit A